MTEFAERLLDWFDVHGRHDLPWQHPREPYRVWLSEVMLQQTQVRTAIPYFLRFVDALPDVPALAAAPLDRVLALWSGLGYYARARNLHRAAQACVDEHGGALPDRREALEALPGIGRSTAAAILAQAHGQREAILDGNVKRVLARHFGVDGHPGETAVQKRLWALSESLLPQARLADYTQAQMDLGATVCTRRNPDCARCPLAGTCVAAASGRQHELPTPRPRRGTPLRHTHMLLLLDRERRLLLQRRPASGIWGGLWSLPEDEDPGQLQALATRWSGASGPPWHLDAFEHVFSHFRLNIQPLAYTGVEASATRIGDNGDLHWHRIDAVAGLGLPAPVARLIQCFRESTD